MGLSNISLNYYNDSSSSIEDFFKNYRLFPKFLAGSLAYMLLVGAGLYLFIIPGIYFALKCQFFGYLIVDKGMGPIDTMRGSYKITKGAEKSLFVFWLTLCCSIIVIAATMMIFILLPRSIITSAWLRDVLPLFNLIVSIIWMVIGLMIIFPIVKLSMVDIYKILLQHNALEASPSESLEDSGIMME